MWGGWMDIKKGRQGKNDQRTVSVNKQKTRSVSFSVHKLVYCFYKISVATTRPWGKIIWSFYQECTPGLERYAPFACQYRQPTCFLSLYKSICSHSEAGRQSKSCRSFVNVRSSNDQCFYALVELCNFLTDVYWFVLIMHFITSSSFH